MGAPPFALPAKGGKARCGRWGSFASHPCARKRAQGWGTQVCRWICTGWAIFALLAGVCWTAAAQAVPLGQSSPAVPAAAFTPGPYRISGTVVNAITGEPVRRATVAVLSDPDSQTVESVKSDNEGHFTLPRLPAAKYQLTASKRGYRTAFYDEHDEFSSAIVTGPDQDTSGLQFKLTPGALLRGVVTGDGGDPVEGARMMLFLKPKAHRLGARTVQVDAATTDDTGAYEFGNLAAGEYLLAVMAEPWYSLHRSGGGKGPKPANDPAAALDVAYPVTYFDSTVEEAAATPIVLAGGGIETANVNLHAVTALHLIVETPRKADGSVARPELRQSIFGTQVSAESLGMFDASRAGTVEFNGVSPGHYELAQGDPPRVVELDATASQLVDPAAGTPSVAVSGTLRTASGFPPPDDVSVTLVWLDGAHGQEPIQANARKGHFNFDAVPPGTWEIVANTNFSGGGGKALPVIATSVDGMSHAGNRVTVRDRPLSLAVTLTQGQTRITGFARKDGKGFAGAMIVLVPKELAALRAVVRRDQSDSDGSFSLADVAPGDYTVVAIEDGWELDWAQPDVIRRYLSRGVAVTVTDKTEKLLALPDAVPVQAR